jgi:transcriptional regulator with XRE-family HTH domain
LKEPEKVNGMQDMPIGERIRLYRRRRGLSQPRLAQLIGRSESWLSQVDRGVRSVDRFSTIIELARVLRVQVVDLTGGRCPSPPTAAPTWRPWTHSGAP